MHNATIKSLSADLAARRISSVELTRHFLNRIKSLNDKLNCFITLGEEASLKQAEAADRQRANGSGHPLTGIPI
ncbi:MAG TPA: amidase family protein, partial [Burkholderiales bacterium]|nr:amidase family protein [Burkholderiales bacterium]